MTQELKTAKRRLSVKPPGASNILLISDLTGGGAAISCRRLFQALRGQGCDATWVAARGDAQSGARIASDWPNLGALLLQRLFARAGIRGRWLEHFGQSANEKNVLGVVRGVRPRLINLHNIHGSASFELARALPSRLPIVWTLHDMWPLTGYCRYSMDCGDFAEGCRGACIQAGQWGETWRSPPKEWLIRERFFAMNSHRIAFACPSRWMARQVRARFGGRFRVEHIPYSLDLKVFKPLGDKRSIRKMLGLPVDRPLVMAGAHSLEDGRKGSASVAAAVDRLSGGTCGVIALGDRPQGRSLPSNWTPIGFIKDERLLNLYYNAADVYVLPTMADNLPNTLIESVAAGTICVAFDVGGCSDVVRDGQTGFLAKPADIGALSEGIRRVLESSPEERDRMSGECRSVAVRDYAPSVQAAKYETLFGDMLAGSRV